MNLATGARVGTSGTVYWFLPEEIVPVQNMSDEDWWLALEDTTPER